MVIRSKARKRTGKEASQSQLVTLRMPQKLLAHFRASGPGYQTRIREALEDHVERQSRLIAFDKACARMKSLSPKDRSALAILSDRPLNKEALIDPFDALSR